MRNLHSRSSRLAFVLSVPLLAVLAACGSDEASVTGPPVLSVAIGLGGGVVEGQPGTPFEGVKLVIPDLGLTKPTTITVTPVALDAPLPATAEGVGPAFELGPVGLVLQKPATLTLPVDSRTAASFGQDYRQVKVWLLGPEEAWLKREAVDSQNADLVGRVTVSVEALGQAAAGVVVEAATGRCKAPCDTQRSPTPLALPQPAFGGRLAVAGGRAGVLVVAPSASGVTLAGQLAPLDGGAVTTTAGFTLSSATALWPDRGLALLEGGVMVGVDGGLVRLDATEAGWLAGDTLAVQTTGTGAAWVVREDGKVQVRLLDAAGALVGAPIQTSRPADGPIPTACDGETLALGVMDHVVLIALGDAPAVVAEVPLVAGTRIDAIAANGVTLDRAGRLRAPDGLPLAVTSDLVHLTGGGTEIFGLVPGASVAVRIVSTTKPTRPGEVPPFEASKVTELNLGAVDSPVARAMRVTPDGALVVLDRTGALVVYR